MTGPTLWFLILSSVLTGVGRAAERDYWMIDLRVFSSSLHPPFYIVGEDGVARDNPDAGPMPVALELIQTAEERTELLMGVMTMPGGDSRLTMTMCFDDSLLVSTPALGETSVQVRRLTGEFRVILLPAPEFWNPGIEGSELGPPAETPEQPFEICARLFLYPAGGGRSYWSFPPDLSETFCFTHVVTPDMDIGLGFSAAMDVTLEGGLFVGTPVLLVDADADGHTDMEIEGEWIERN
jgi:hypothetical protein